MAGFTKEEFDTYYRFASAPIHMMQLIRCCFVTPRSNNLHILYHDDKRWTGFSQFLRRTLVELSEMDLREIGNHPFVPEEEKDEYKRHQLNVFSNPHRPWIDHTDLGVERARASEEEVNQLLVEISPHAMVKVVEAFMINFVNKENPRHLAEIAKRWRQYIDEGASVFARECKDGGLGRILYDFGKHDTDSWHNNYRTISQNQIDGLFQMQMDIARRRNIKKPEFLQKKARQIIKAYEGLLEPEVVVYRGQAPEVVSLKREEFPAVRRAYLKQAAELLKNKGPLLPEYARLSLEALSAMEARGSFGQEKGDDRIESLTLDHAAPLVTSDNFNDNFSIVSRLINHDLNMLVWLQTGAMGMKQDRIRKQQHKNMFYNVLETSGEFWPIVVLRPPMTDGMRLPIVTLPNAILNNWFRTNKEKRQIEAGRVAVKPWSIYPNCAPR